VGETRPRSAAPQPHYDPVARLYSFSMISPGSSACVGVR
jgi:hypothetical protein